MVADLHATSGYCQQPYTTGLYYGFRTRRAQVPCPNSLRWLLDWKSHRSIGQHPRTPQDAQDTTWTGYRNTTPHRRHLSGICTRRLTAIYNAVIMTTQSSKTYRRIHQLFDLSSTSTSFCMPPPYQFCLESTLFDFAHSTQYTLFFFDFYGVLPSTSQQLFLRRSKPTAQQHTAHPQRATIIAIRQP